MSPHGQSAGTQLRVKVPRLTQADPLLGTTWPHILICTWKATPLAGAVGCKRPETLVHGSENKMHIHPQGQDRAKKGKQEILLCFHRHLNFHDDFVAHSTFRRGDHRCTKAKSLSLTSFPANPDQYSATQGPCWTQENQHSLCHPCLYFYKFPWAQRLSSG